VLQSEELAATSAQTAVDRLSATKRDALNGFTDLGALEDRPVLLTR